MSLTLGLTGMDQATEVALKAAFNDASERIRGWSMATEADADYVIVDMDSMYGPMSWLRLHAAGKKVIGLTSAPRTQADFRLIRPFSGHQLAIVLGEIDGSATVVSPSLSDAAPVAAAVPQTVDEPVTSPAQAPPQPRVPEPVPPPPAPPVVAVAVPAAPMPPANTTPVQPTPAASPLPEMQAPAAPTAAVAVAIEREEPAGPASRVTAFAHWLRPGALTGRARYQSGKGPELLIDFSQRLYFGPPTLKPLAEYFIASVGLRDFEQLDDRAWQEATARLGAPQPLTRLQWLGGLLAGEGRLLPGYNPEGRFALGKWPETEREYPRHFRISTAMMKGPQTIAEIAAASSVPAADVVDFINANLATGFAEQTGDAAASADTGKSGSLLDRLRGR
jgi:hypothetical protein